MGSAWNSLMATDSGLLSLAVFIFMLGMGVFFVVFFIRKIRAEDAAAQHGDTPHKVGH